MDRFLEFLLYLQGPLPYVAAFGVLLACGLGLPIPEDVTLFAIGLLSYYGLVDLKTSIAVCLVGVLSGDIMIYWIGHHYGVHLLKRGIFAKLLPHERMERVRQLFHKYGNKMIFMARFMPGLRAPAYFSAGSLHLPFRVFIFYDGMAAMISVPLLIGVIYHFGDHVDRAVKLVRRVQNGVAIVILVVAIFFVLKHYILNRRRSGL